MSGNRWRRLRRRILDRDGWRCQAPGCGKAGRLEVDHIIALEDGGDPWAEDNLQALCRACHIEKTAREYRARNPDPPEVQAWKSFVEELAGPELVRTVRRS